MNYISLRFIYSTMASSPPFMIVFNPHHIFIQNKYPRMTPCRAQARRKRNVWVKLERHGDLPAQLSLLSDDILDKTFS